MIGSTDTVNGDEIICMSNFLEVIVPNTYLPERKYIVNLLLSEFLGLDYKLRIDTCAEYVTVAYENSKLEINDGLFLSESDIWMQLSSLPKLPLSNLNLLNLPFSVKAVQCMLPIIYGEAGVICNKNKIKIGLDIFGSCFFMLSRYEEYIVENKDVFDRFPSSCSIAKKAGFLHRPIVNEYTELLWSAMSYLWPELRRKKRAFKCVPSHDVDRPFLYKNMTWLCIVKRVIEDVFLKGSVIKALDRSTRFLLSKCTFGKLDPFNTFNYLLDESKNRGLLSEFYFLSAVTHKDKDADYTLFDCSVVSLMKKISSQGHQIGLHPSFESYNSVKQIEYEFNCLMACCERIGIKQTTWGGRQHYLRWDARLTALGWERAELNFDSSLGYADAPGFRTGCCYEYPLFDVINKKELVLIERPLILMDSSIMSEVYMSLSLAQKKELIVSLKSACKLFNGVFVILWHNSNLTTHLEKSLYEFCLDC